MCDDWFIFAKDDDGQMYYVSTELLPEWLDYPETAPAEYSEAFQPPIPI
jgi:hypothetical protein